VYPVRINGDCLKKGSGRECVSRTSPRMLSSEELINHLENYSQGQVTVGAPIT
jgi:hypothetical protein